MLTRFIITFTLLFSLFVNNSQSQAFWESKLSPELLASNKQQLDVVIQFSDKFNVKSHEKILLKFSDKYERRAYVIEQLKQISRQSQHEAIELLESQGIDYRSYWGANALFTKVDKALLQSLADLPQVNYISWLENNGLNMALATETQAFPQYEKVEINNKNQLFSWFFERVKINKAWEQGIYGENVVVGILDSGVAWQIDQLKNSYRGWNDDQADHNYNWYSGFSNFAKYPNDSYAIFEGKGHGTGITGLIASQGIISTGVAPDAKWIACKGFNTVADTEKVVEAIIKCYEWFLEPTDLEGNHADVTQSPDIINITGSCRNNDGSIKCSNSEIKLLEEITFNVNQAGILSVGSVGNATAHSCASIDPSFGSYAHVLSVGGSTLTDGIDFGGFGPTSAGLMKPDIVAPSNNLSGINTKGAYYTCNGVQYSTAITSGVAALLMSANPNLQGNPNEVREIIKISAMPLFSDTSCGGVSGNSTPNNIFGYGLLDAEQALLMAGIAEETDISPKQGLYWNPNANGHGYQLAMVDNDGEDELVVFVYTYDEANENETQGAPTWYLSDGAKIDGNVWEAPLRRYHRNEEGEVSNEIVGSLRINFNDNASGTVSWELADIGLNNGSESIERFVFGGEVTNLTGAYADLDELGYGITVDTQAPTSGMVLYYYDASGNGRWVLGIDEDKSGDYEMLSYRGYCLSCPMTEITSEMVGEVIVNDIANNTLGLDINITYPGMEGGDWRRSDIDMTRLTLPID